MFGFRVPWKSLRDRQRRFLQERREEPQSDVGFLSQAMPSGREDEKAVVLSVRRAIAVECCVPAELLYANDRTDDLEELMGPRSLLQLLYSDVYGFDADMVFTVFLQLFEKEIGGSGKLDKKLFDKICYEWWRGPFPSRKGLREEPRYLGDWAACLARSIAARSVRD